MPRLLLLILLLLPASGLRAQDSSAKPNIILFFADDMGMGDTSVYQDWCGNADEVQLHTPNMQRLANMGVRFTDALAAQPLQHLPLRPADRTLLLADLSQILGSLRRAV